MGFFVWPLVLQFEKLPVAQPSNTFLIVSVSVPFSDERFLEIAPGKGRHADGDGGGEQGNADTLKIIKLRRTVKNQPVRKKKNR